MTRVVTLKNWCEGETPDKNDLLSWSELIFQRALQIKEPGIDPISQYFVEQWLEAKKEKELVLPIFDRTFSAYGERVQISLLNALISENVFSAAELVDYVRPNGFLHRHLLTLSEVWLGIGLHKLRDQLHSSFECIVKAGEDDSNTIHPAWGAMQRFQTTVDRNRVFNAILSSRIQSAFGLFRDGHAHFSVAAFHRTVQLLGKSWHVHPAQIAYGLLRADSGWSVRDYDQYEAHIKPYANDIRELIQFSAEPRDVRIRQNLPASLDAVSVDILAAFCIGADQDNLFLDFRHIPTASNDLESADALKAAISLA